MAAHTPTVRRIQSVEILLRFVTFYAVPEPVDAQRLCNRLKTLVMWRTDRGRRGVYLC